MAASSPEASAMRRKSSEIPSLRSIAAEAPRRSRRKTPSASLGCGRRWRSPCPTRFPLEAESRAAEPSGDVDGIAGAGAIAPQCAAARNGPADHDIARRFGRARQVAAGQRDAATCAPGATIRIKAIDPAPVRARAGGERKQAEARHATHGGDIAQSARQRLVAQRFGRVRIVMEMHVFHQQIGGEQQVFPRAPRAVNSAIVADAQHQAAPRWQLRPAADGFQDVGLAAA
jgi:hypothetical protein